MFRVLLFLLLSSMVYAQTIRVGVAANVSYAIVDLVKEFNKKHPDIKVQTILGSSGKLAIQALNNAPFDLFMSANMAYPQKLYDAKKVLTKPRVYAKGALVLFSVKPRKFHCIETIQDKNIRRIACGNPKTAPYGVATKEALQNAKLYNKTKSKFIYAESISQTVFYTMTSADVGFIAKSALFSSKMKRFKKDKNWIEIDKKLYTPISQGIVLLKQNSSAKAFYEFIFSDPARKIFKKYGYIVE